MTQGFNENLYLIDLSYLKTPAEVVYDLSSILDNDLAKNQRVKLKLGNVDFNKSQLLSIKSLIESINSTLSIIEGESDVTRASALAIGLVYQNSVDKVQDIIYFGNDASQNQNENKYKEVKPDLFPEVTPIIKNEVSNINSEEACQEDISEKIDEPNNKNSEEKFEEKKAEYTGETFEIQPQKFETTDENLNFDDNKQDWLESTQERVVEELNNNSEQNISLQSSENNDEQAENEKKNLIEKVNSLFDEESGDFLNTENTADNQNQEVNNLPEDNSNSEENNDEVEAEKVAPGIQALSDIPLDIPNDKTIQEELDVIYSAERKLDDLFETTGLKEEKFQSLKDAPKAEEQEYTQYDFELEAFPTKYLKQTICAGQYISYEGNIVIIGDCHEGSEISAAGDVTVWGELSGSVHAGKNGNEKCKIRALKMNASQLRISNSYVKRPSVLNDSSKVDAIPEEAMIQNGEIAVYRIYK